MRDELSSYLQVAQQTAVLGGLRLRAEFGNAVRLGNKGGIEPVTQSDIGAEEVILNYLQQHFPAHGYLSEEAGSEPGEGEYLWIIDPLDGTTNFIHGLPDFSISIALQQNSRTVVAVVYMPMTGDMYSATLHGGAYLNGNRLHVSEQKSLHDSLIGTGFGCDHALKEAQYRVLGPVLEHCGAIREPGSATVGLCNVACGRYDAYWELGLQLWDVAAGMLLVAEAGGMADNIPGSRLGRFDNNVLASNGLLHRGLRDVINSDSMSGGFQPPLKPF